MRRLEDRIRSLCARAVKTEGDEDLRPLLNELREALRQHVERIRTRFSDYSLAVERRVKDEVPGPDGFPSETPLPQNTPAKIKAIDLESIDAKTNKPSNGPANGTPGS